MTRLADNVRQALGYWWPLVLDAANGGYTTTDTVSAASAIAQDNGRTLSFDEAGAIATLYGYARRMSNAADALAALPPDSPITPDAVGTPPWARDIQEQATLPVWHVTFDFTYIDQAGNQQTDFRTSVFEMTLSSTAGGLFDDVQSDAEAMAAKYEVQLVGVSNLRLVSV